MSDFTNTFGGAAKDGASATVLGADHDTQLDALATMSATKADKLNLFPVGAIYLSTVVTDPGTIFGGTWGRISEGRVLIGEGTGVGLTARTAAAEIGVEDSVVVSHTHPIDHDHAAFNTSSSGTHTHEVEDIVNATGSGLYPKSGSNLAFNASQTTTGTGNHVHSINVPAITDTSGAASSGVSGTDKNMQPSLVVYIWERTA